MSAIGRALLLGSALQLVACGSSAGDESELVTLRSDDTIRVSSREHVEVDVQAGPIRLGKNTLVVSFPTRAGALLASASALMPAHGHGSSPPSVEMDDKGEFVVRDLVLYMSGRWELRLALRVDTREDEAIVGIDVP